jgi:hypothetical protein
MTDIARVVASLACCAGLLGLLGVAWGMCAIAGRADGYRKEG